MRTINRRSFLRQTSGTVGAFAVAGAFHNFLLKAASASGAVRSGGYGPLQPVKDETTGVELLQLPEGFRYQSYGWRLDPLSTGGPTPAAHDGMAVIQSTDETITICRNHEVGGQGSPFAGPVITYDPKAGGGCTMLEFDSIQGKFVSSRPCLTGTVKNCAGGPTPWGSWLSCEETVLGPGDEDDGLRLGLNEEHGYIFEVPAKGVATTVPLKDMGRFVHEAVAVDPKTSIVYETEDRDPGGFYRFVPNTPRKLSDGGRLQMMLARGRRDLRKGLKVGDQVDTEWVDIDDPTRAHSPGTKDEHGVFRQGSAQGGTTFARLEGCWFGSEKVYFVSTSGGEAGLGQVFEFDPREETIKLIFESPSADVLDSPDTMTVSPGGGIVLCEDGDFLPQRLHGLSSQGELFPLAANNVVLEGQRNGFRGDFRKEEWAGATFSPDGKWVFANIQSPGITFAITGPWTDGPLS